MGRSPRRHRSWSRSRSASRQQLKRGRSRSRSKSRSKSRSRGRGRSRSPVRLSARQHLPPSAAAVGNVNGRNSSRDLGRHDSGPHTAEQRHRSRSIDRQPLRRSSGSKRSRSRSRSRERRHSSRGHRSRSRSRSRDKAQYSDRDGRGRRDGRHSPRSSSRSRSRRRSRSRKRSRSSRSRDRAGGSSRQGLDAAAGFPGPPAEGRPHPDHPDTKRSRWDAPQQQQFGQQQQRGWGEPGHGSRWDAGRPGGDVNTGRRGLPGPPLSDDPPAIGSIHRGVVQAVKPFGVFVAIEGFRRHVLVHHTQVSELVMLTRSDEDELKVKALEYAAPVGQRVWAKILEVSPDQTGSGGFRVHGSMKVVDQESGQDLDPTGQMAAARGPGGGGGGGGRLSDEPPEVGTIHKGEVKRIEAYGVFVALPGFRKYGLVHASQVANYLEFSAEDGEAERKKALSEVVDLGQAVWVKVVEVGEDEKGRGPKIGCSIKLVDQGDGTDLDPQNMRYRPRGEGHGPQGGNKAPIGAHVGEVKGGAIDWGYLATRPDAFGSSGYDLLTDPPPEPVQQGGPGQHQHHQHHQHHHHLQQQQHRQQQQGLPPMGRGRGAVVPAWMSQQQQGGPGGGPAAPGSAAPPSPGTAGPNMTLEEALKVVQAAAAGSKQHKKKHKKEKSKKHKKEKSSRKDSKRDRHRSHSRSSSTSRGSDSDRR